MSTFYDAFGNVYGGRFDYVKVNKDVPFLCC